MTTSTTTTTMTTATSTTTSTSTTTTTSMATTKTTTTTTAMTAGPVFDDFSDFVKIFQFSSGNGTAGIVTSGEGRRGWGKLTTPQPFLTFIGYLKFRLGNDNVHNNPCLGFEAECKWFGFKALGWKNSRSEDIWLLARRS